MLCSHCSFMFQAVEELPLASDYLKNYQRAVSTIHRLAEQEENARFVEITTDMRVVGMKETQHLEGTTER